MNVLIMSKDGELLGIADRLVREGHMVKVFAETKNTGFGIYELITRQEVYSAIKWCKFIVSDQEHNQDFYDKVAMYNKPIVGNSFLGNLVNSSAVHEYAICEKMEVTTPKTKVVTEIAEIYEAIMDWDLPRYDIRFDRKWFAGRHTEFMSWAVGRLPVGKTVLMQEPIDGETDIRLIGLFNGQDFLPPFFATTENTEENGHCVVVPLEDKNRLADQNLIKITNWLRSVDYHGPVEAKLTLDGDKIWMRELYLGFRFPVMYAILEGLECQVGTLFNALALGIQTEKLLFLGKLAVALETTSKEWQHLKGAPILELHNPNKLKHVFPIGVMKSNVEEDEYFVSGECETVYTAAAWAGSLTEAKKRVIRTVNDAQFPSMIFNPHIHLSANYPLSILEKRNYINA